MLEACQDLGINQDWQIRPIKLTDPVKMGQHAICQIVNSCIQMNNLENLKSKEVLILQDFIFFRKIFMQQSHSRSLKSMYIWNTKMQELSLA